MQWFEILLSHNVESCWTMTLRLHIPTHHVTLLDQRGIITYCGCLIAPNVVIKLCKVAQDLGIGLLCLIPTAVVFHLARKQNNKTLQQFNIQSCNSNQIEEISGFSKNLVQKQLLTHS